MRLDKKTKPSKNFIDRTNLITDPAMGEGMDFLTELFFRALEQQEISDEVDPLNRQLLVKRKRTPYNDPILGPVYSNPDYKDYRP